MSIIPIKITTDITLVDKEIHNKTFKELEIREAQIEEFIRKNVDEIFEDETLYIVGQQIRNSRNGISDLVAIDDRGSIVLIEIKRDADDIRGRRESFEFQAIRYAASFARLKTPRELVEKVFSGYIEKHRSQFELGELTPVEKGLRILNDFLEKNNALQTFNRKQRIILIASAFDRQTESAVAWLIANNVDISCFTIQPMAVDQELFLNVNKILPPPALDDYYIDITPSKKLSDKSGSDQSRISRTQLPRMAKLMEWGIIKPGDKLYIKNSEDSEAIVIDDKNVNHKGQRMKYNDWGQSVTGWSAIQIYAWALLNDTGKTLHELRLEKMESLEKEANED